MNEPEVRDIEKRFNLWGGFRDELIATAMTLSLVVVGSFIALERFVAAPPVEPTPIPIAAPKTLGVTDTAPAVALPTSAPASTPIQASPSGQPIELAEVVYGEDGDYDFDGYSISFTNPRLQFDKKTNLKRKLIVSVHVKNKTIPGALPLKLTASIVKDGVVIVADAALNIPGSRVVGLGDEVLFEASLPLIEATDVREIKFKPGNNLPEASHFLYP